MGKIMKYKYEDIEVELEYNYKPENRHAYIKITNDKVIINSFKRFNRNDVDKIFSDYYPKIKKALAKKVNESHSLHLFGKAYDFKIIDSSINLAYLENDIIYIKTKVNEISYIKKIIDSFYNSYLEDFISNHYNDIYIKFSDVVLVRPTIKYKSLKGCYGKYNKKENSITLSSHLAKYNPILIEQVIAHELSHYKYMNHQKEFYDLLESKMPGAKKLQHILRMTKYNDYF